jgi:hypothetical protein
MLTMRLLPILKGTSIWKEFLRWDMFLGICGVKREWVPIIVMEDCID